jgi:hypothetical protein
VEFELSKWYGDCISESGEVRIAYSARVRYGRLKVGYSGLLDGETATHSLRPYRIADEGQTLSWEGSGRSAALSAKWTRQDAPLRATVFESEEGAVEWCPVMPKGSASMNGVCGLGYAEHLRMTIAPWKLPIRTLRWGRFLTPNTTLIWMDWQGPFATRIVFFNGQRVLAEAIDDGGLLLDNRSRIYLDRAHVLRGGDLGSTVFAAVPGIGRIAPARMFRVDECKWKSRARMQVPGEPAEDGWCIHEVVNWPCGE